MSDIFQILIPYTQKHYRIIMYGYQRVRLTIYGPGSSKIINVPHVENFKMVLSSNTPNQSNIDILLEAEDPVKDEVYNKLKQQLKNLRLYLNLYSENIIEPIQHDSPAIFPEKTKFEETILTSLDELNDKNLPQYHLQSTTQQQILLQTALNELRNEDLFNAFPKLINWLDDNDGKGSSRFCSIRDSCDHGILDKTRAIKKVNDAFPGEFEFEDDTLKRDSEKNKESMKKHLPEVLNHIKRVFKTKYVS